MTKPKISDAEKAVLTAMHDYPLEPGQMLLLGPLSVAYLSGDHFKAPWLLPSYKPPGGKMLPDLLKIEKSEWNAS